jgi:hypothetical protein
MNIVKALSDKKLFRSCFKSLDSWGAWMVLLKALFGLPMAEGELALYRRCTGRERPPEREFRELWAIVGRRGGKSFMMSVVAVFLALFYDYKKHLSPGERGVIQVIAADRGQAQVILNYIKGILENNPVFRQYVEQSLKESIDLSNSISIEVMSCSYRSVRGRTVVCAIFDEIAFWRVEGANPDHEILSAIRPAMATIPNSKLLVISSPYARSGILYEHHRDYFGKEDPDILVWQSDTRTMNPMITQELIDRERAKDPTAAGAEWDAQFRSDIESFLTLDAINAVAVLDGDLSPNFGTTYRAFVDPSGGRHDAFTLAIGHRDRSNRLVVDLLKGWVPPFTPESVVAEIAGILSRYRVFTATGDRYAAQWVTDAFKRHGITHTPSDKSRSDIYCEFAYLVNDRSIEIPNHKLLTTELVNLERRTGRGKDIVDHPPRGSDDYPNAVAGVCFVLKTLRDSFFANCSFPVITA